MDQCKLWFVLLLPLCLCLDREATLVKTSGREPYVAAICSTDSLRKNSLVLCKISREGRGGEDCFFTHKHGKDFVSECDPRFTIRTENQTLFLHLSGLTPADSAVYTCKCPYPDATDVVHLNITVEEPSSSSRKSSVVIAVVVCACVVVAGLLLGSILRNRLYSYLHNRRSGAAVCETPISLEQDDPDNPYTSLQQPADDLYQIIYPVYRRHDNKKISASSSAPTAHLEDREIDGEETEIYENI